MRFESLFLERFGAFEDAVLEFGDGVGLHLIYGGNEAGKSTTLTAMSDLLFGIDDRTPFNFRFEYGKLRIGGRIVNSNGDRLEFKRRKARTGTLISLSVPETTLPDAALAPFLGQVDRNQFHLMFGLDQERLRTGGQQMLSPQGNFAHALFAAGTGLESVNAVLSELDEEIKCLGSLVDRRSKGEIWSAIDRFTGAVSAKKADMIVPDQYHAAETARDDAAMNRLAVDGQLKSLRARRNFLEHGRRVAPTLAALRALRSELVEYDAIPDLPEDFSEIWKRADDDARSAAEALARGVAEMTELTERLDAAPVVDPILGFEDVIGALGERLGKYLGDEDDVPKLARRIVEANDQLQTVQRALGLGDDPTDIEAALPSKITFAKVRELIKDGAVIRSALDSARTDHEDARLALVDAEAALEGLPPDVDLSEPNERLAEAAKLGDVTGALGSTKRDAAAADLSLSEALGRLGFWSGTADELACLPVPDMAAISGSDERFAAARQSLDTLIRKIEENQRDSLQVEADLAGLAAAGEVPSPRAIRDARDDREEHWRRIRSLLPIAPITEPPVGVMDQGLLGTYETSVRHADELVDRREAEAQRVAQLTTLTANQRKIARTGVDLDAQRKAAEDDLQRLEGDWHELWKDTGVSAKSPVEMARWLMRRDDVLRLRGEAQKAAGKVQDARATADRARMHLEKAAQMLNLRQPAPDLEGLDRQLRQALSRLTTAAAAKSAAEATVKTAREENQRAENALERATAAEAKWQAAWHTAVIDLHLAPTAGVAEAEAALGGWEAITAPLTRRKEDQRRLNGLNEDLDKFRADVAALVDDLGEGSLTGMPVEKIVRQLKTRLDAAKGASQEQATLGKRIAELQTALDQATERSRSAAFVIEGIRRTYGFSPDADAYDLARRSSQRRRLRAQIDDRVQELGSAGDALDEATLQAEVDSISADQARAELAAIQQEEGALIGRIQLLAKEETEAEHVLAALGGRRGAAGADQEARNAAAAAGGHIERWLRLEVARRLLERSVRRYQDENQNPLITRASELFARVANTVANPIERITVDYRNAAKPVPIGRRHDGSECGLEGLSEATRDQLFLSLRVAAIERFCQHNEPLPFVVDDLFMTSDEQRVLPLLQILSELGRTTQVIAFTHHRHVIDIAKDFVEGIRIHTMPATA
ncbi:AAA family ATPase [Telmatospirillum sp.]|uniref:AAA family ATPase n=1 Tax=Telmatospirillum sp. TaxID=2079197 RepID=UPI00283D5B2A|nr:AAA family ATPase [Telmatospirillum sp.]MDR3438203.1 AAA family ATPase [Telmatospirillum sp.]